MTSDRSPPGRPGDEERDEPELSLEELESEAAGSLPDRQAMSLIDASVTITATPALAADVLADTLGDARTEPDPGDEGGDGVLHAHTGRDVHSRRPSSAPIQTDV